MRGSYSERHCTCSALDQGTSIGVSFTAWNAMNVRPFLCMLLCLGLALPPGLAGAQASLPAGLGELNRLELALAAGQPYTAMNGDTLAGFHVRIGNYVLAEPLSKRLLDADPKRFGQWPDEPTAVKNLQHLALLYQEQGRLDDALPMLARALSLEERAAGDAHPDVATALSLLAGLQMRRGQYADAEDHYRRALAIDEAALGARHPAVAAATGNLGAALAMQRRFAEAEPLLLQALALHARQQGADSPDARLAARNLGVLLTQQGRSEEAAAQFAGLLALYRTSPDGQEPLLARDLHRLADHYTARGELQSAEPLYKRALQVNQRALGETHARNAQTLVTLGDLYSQLALHALAATQYREALRLLDALPQAPAQTREDVRSKLAQLPSVRDDTP